MGRSYSPVSKYRSKRTSCGQHEHASKKEARRCGELQTFVRAGLIRDLTQQPRFPLKVNDLAVCEYRGDFQYRVIATGDHVIEDCKGVKTDVYKIKRKLMKAVYGIEVLET